MVPRPFQPITSTTTNSSQTASSLPPPSLTAATEALSGGKSATTSQQFFEKYQKLMWEWLQANWTVLVLNFGSVCTLLGFTRSDILELRALSVTGSLSFVVYQLFSPPTQKISVAWSCTFASINSYKIWKILEERNSSVRLTSEQEDIYVQYFMPHGVTPKQFDKIYQKAKVITVKRGQPIVTQGEKLKGVYLVVQGKTRATALGRRISAVSSSPTPHDDRVSVESGAWIGEIAFLEQYWIKEQERMRGEKSEATHTSPPLEEKEKPQISKKSSGSKQPSETRTATQDATERLPSTEPKREARLASKRTVHSVPFRASKLRAGNSLYTVTATGGDCTVLLWSHADMEDILAHSTDMRSAMTRAMSAAIVGKVINFTVSRSRGSKPWAFWLEDFKHSAGKTNVQVEDVGAASSDEEEEDLPTFPIKQFGPSK